ncbi:hypothetical protein JCM8208_007156 [Rhodotorula glutinis]
MCTSIATLVFGITIQALELCIAAAGYERVKPALLAIGLIRARKANGALETSTPERRRTACALPVEIWDLIELNIMRQSYLDQWFRVRSMYGADWSDDDCCEDYCSGHESGADSSLTFVDALRGDYSVDSFIEEGGVYSTVHDNEKVVVNMLQSFGLRLATVDVISKEESSFFDFAASWAISIPFMRDGDKAKAYPHVRGHIPHEGDSTHQLYRISPSTFDLPADASTRFRRLLSSFPSLVPTSYTSGTIRPLSSSSMVVEAPQDNVADEKGTAKKKLSKEERLEREREKKRAAREPGWMLMASGSSCS